MKNKRPEVEVEVEDEKELEILKAVAQAWHGHSGISRATNEFDAYRRNFKSQPSRFKLEAIKYKSSPSNNNDNNADNWDFKQSLWDSYEIVAVSKKLEAELVLDNPFSGLDNNYTNRVHRKRKEESKNSLRRLFNRLSSRRFDGGADVHSEDEDEDE